MDHIEETEGEAQDEHQAEVRAADADRDDSAQAAAGPDMPVTVTSATPGAPAVQAPRTDKYSLRGNMVTDHDHRRKLQGLELQRERILSERTSSPHRRSALAAALTDIEEKLAELGWTLHL